jgi:hypothetical protein
MSDAIDSEAVEGANERQRQISRRRFLLLGGTGVLGAGLLSGAGVVGYRWPRAAPAAAATSTRSLSQAKYRTQPTLDPPVVKVTNLAGANDSGYIFVTPSVVPGERLSQQAGTAEGLGQQGTMILDQFGHLVWFQPTADISELAGNLRVQTYKGNPVLTYWHGKVVDGIGYGEGVILDSSYRQIATVKAGGSAQADLHDFTLTPQGTALITAYLPVSADLSSVGGPKKGTVEDCMIQEIDVATGKVVFEWHCVDHVEVSESYSKPSGDATFDYFHLNSINVDGDGHLLISSRATWTVYQLDRATGAITWRLNGKHSDFKMGPGTPFAWQHHATRLADGNISIFDDEAEPQIGPQSRAIVLDADETSHTATLVKAYVHPAKLISQFEGSAEMMENGHMFVGWGGEPYFSEFDADGSLVLDGRFPTNDQSYRAFRMPWSGVPAAAPDVAVEADEVGGTAVYASWNGATEAAYWKVLAGNGRTSLTPLATVVRDGFETAITVHTSSKYLAVAALDKSGKELAVSKVVTR